MDTKKLIEHVCKAGGSELHLKAGSHPLMRRNKFLRRINSPVLQAADMQALIKELLTEDDQKRFARKSIFENNFFGQPPCNFRLILMHSQQKPVAVIKLIDSKIPTLEEIKFPEVLTPVLDAKKGLFIIAGPARSGITTTLAAMIERINTERARHVLIIEDPIEFNFQPKRCRISQRQFRKDILNIQQGINFAKRMDVDVLAIGDLKGDMPYKNIMEYVAGGHFVILSMQTLGISNTLEKFLYSFAENDRDYVCQFLVENLLGVLSQTLVADITGKHPVPVQEILTMNNTVQSIVQKGKMSQIEANIVNAGQGSQLFQLHIQRLNLNNEIDRFAGEAFLEFYRGMRG